MTAPADLNHDWGFICSSSDLTLKNLNFTGASAASQANVMSIVCAKLTDGTSKFENLTVSECSLMQTAATKTLGIGCIIGNNSASATIDISDVTVG